MQMNVFASKPSLRNASRLPALSDELRISATEIACLLGCGMLAAVAVGFGNQIIRGVPGHAILRGVLPMALGLALVPRRSAGMTMSLSAGLTAAVMSWQGVGRFQPAAILSVVVLGPVLDAALAGHWWLYARFFAAGAIANLLAFAMRFSMAFLGWQAGGGGGGRGGGGGTGGGGGQQFMDFWSAALVSFLVCGALAGLVSAAVWFRMRVNNSR
jgi:hypothetical protein